MRTFRVNRMFPHVCARDEAAMFARIWQLAFFLAETQSVDVCCVIASRCVNGNICRAVVWRCSRKSKTWIFGGDERISLQSYSTSLEERSDALIYKCLVIFDELIMSERQSKMRNVGRRPLAKAGIHSRVDDDDDRIIKSQSFCGPRLAMNDGASFLWALLELNAISKVSAQFVRKQLRWFDRDSRARLTSVRSVGEKWWSRGPKWGGDFSIQDDFNSKNL